MSFRNLKKTIVELLKNEDLDQAIHWIRSVPTRQVVNPLLQLLNTTDESLKWRVVTILGMVVSQLADHNMESARDLVRRLMWNLNSESGGIGWGAAEALGEILANHKTLADEYASILLSYIGEGENYIENENIQKGVLWALGRLAEERPELLGYGASFLLPFLISKNDHLRGLAAWTAHLLDSDITRSTLEKLKDDTGLLTLYFRGKLITCRVKDLAKGTI